MVALEVELLGTNPVLPKLALVQQSTDDLALVVDGHAGRINIIEISDDLIDWTTFQEIHRMNGIATS